MSTKKLSKMFIDVTSILEVCQDAPGDIQLSKLFGVIADERNEFADILFDNDDKYSCYAEQVNDMVLYIVDHPPLLAHVLIVLSSWAQGKFLGNMLK